MVVQDYSSIEGCVAMEEPRKGIVVIANIVTSKSFEGAEISRIAGRVVGSVVSVREGHILVEPAEGPTVVTPLDTVASSFPNGISEMTTAEIIEVIPLERMF